MFIAIQRHNRSETRQISTLACPGLGTGTGAMPLLKAAAQMRVAYEHFQKPARFINPTMAQERHERIQESL